MLGKVKSRTSACSAHIESYLFHAIYIVYTYVGNTSNTSKRNLILDSRIFMI